jgi:FKBP-type peptidyl-prolyl cis-trans isomerase
MDSSTQKFIRNGLGMHISIIERGSGTILDTGDLVRIHLRITDLKGYVFNQFKYSQFSILRDNEMIWGVQEASLGSRQGDSLILIVPAHLAHGLAGDLNTIPPLTTLVYYLRIL